MKNLTLFDLQVQFEKAREVMLANIPYAGNDALAWRRLENRTRTIDRAAIYYRLKDGISLTYIPYHRAVMVAAVVACMARDIGFEEAMIWKLSYDA